MHIDVASVDEALGTTRSVRRRLDLTRPVDTEIVVDCIDIAEQAPTGGNRSSRRWLLIRDPEVKTGLAERYRATAGQWMVDTRDRLAGTGHPDEAMMTSAAHLVEHLAEVPVIVVPCILGVHDGSGRPGLFDSVLQSAWSFCVALRARGLGTAWTTAILGDREGLGELLGIPDDVTPVAMLPVAWTIGTDFRRAPRPPAREITYFDHWGRVADAGEGHPLRLADQPGVVVERDLEASPRRVWEVVTDISLPVGVSEELVAVDWAPGHEGPSLGAEFVGSNRHPRRGEWDIRCFVDVFEERRQFGWCTSDRERPGARWRFELEPAGAGTRLRFRVLLGPGPSGLTEVIERMPDDEERIVARRLAEHRTNMEKVVDAIAHHLTPT